MPLRPQYASKIPENCGRYVLMISSSGSEKEVE